MYKTRAERSRTMMRSDENEEDDGEAVPDAFGWTVDGRLWVEGECSLTSALLAPSFSFADMVFFSFCIEGACQNTRSWEWSCE